jgi:hypothetical protein
MMPALRHLQRLLLAAPRHPVHHAMLLVDPARPPAWQIAAQRLGLARSLERVPAAFLDQAVRSVAQPGVMLLPMAIILPRRRPERHFHGKGALSSPASKQRTASSGRLAFFGERNRYDAPSIVAHSLGAQHRAFAALRPQVGAHNGRISPRIRAGSGVLCLPSRRCSSHRVLFLLL